MKNLALLNPEKEKLKEDIKNNYRQLALSVQKMKNAMIKHDIKRLDEIIAEQQVILESLKQRESIFKTISSSDECFEELKLKLSQELSELRSQNTLNRLLAGKFLSVINKAMRKLKNPLSPKISGYSSLGSKIGKRKKSYFLNKTC